MRKLYVFLCALLASVHAEAVCVPKPNASATAGIVERTVEQDFGPRPACPDKTIPLLAVDLPEEQLCISDNEVVHIDCIEFIGNDMFSTHYLKEYLCSYTDAYLTMNDLHELCHAIQELYVSHGYILARAYLPEQEILEGRLVVRILEGNIANIHIQGNCHYSTAFIYNYVRHFYGCPLHYESLLRALLLLNEFDELNVSCVFSKSEILGCTDLILTVSDCRPVYAYASYNNFGVRHTPKNRGGLRLDYGNFLFYGDTLSCIGVLGLPVNDLRFAEMIYEVPLNRRGLWLETSYLRSDFHTDSEDGLEIDGIAQVTNVTLSQELTRTRTLSTDCFVWFDYKRIENFVNDHSSTLDNLRILGAGYSLEYTDCFCGRSQVEVDGYFGLPNFWGGSKSVDPHSSRLGAGGHFYVGNVSFLRVQKLPFDTFLLVNFAGQVSARLLPLSEQFFIGGWDTVRGYPTAYRLGDNGYYVNLELRMAPPCLADCPVWSRWPGVVCRDFIQLVAFIDNGAVHLRHEKKKKSDHNPISTAEHGGFKFLTGAGFGVRLYGPCGWNVVVDVGFPIGHKKNPEVYLKFDWEFL